MKKFIIFVSSFILLFSLLIFSANLLSGIFLTSDYVPNVNEAWNSSATLPQKIEMFSVNIPFSLHLLIALLSATAAYFISQKFAKHSHSKDG